ncbi:hypothetical protein P2318_33775 [Myxococcaceae bacterium GXIMD 01537]
METRKDGALVPGLGIFFEESVWGVSAGLIREARARLSDYAGRPPDIQHRLDELDREWDVERMLGVKAAGLVLLGLVLGARRDRRFYLLPALAAGILLEYGLLGRGAPVELLRRLGVRRRRDIEAERFALMALRGDFQGPGQRMLPL